MVEAILLALALATDVAAVATACGAAGLPVALARRMAWVFAVFHVGMASIGWLAGVFGESWIAAWNHWVAFGLLAIIGGKMVVSTLRRPEVVAFPATWKMLVALAIATSIDAVAAGVTLPLVDAPELFTIGLLGVVVYVFVMVGVRIGSFVGERFGRGLHVIGGLVLIAIGARIVLLR